MVKPSEPSKTEGGTFGWMAGYTCAEDFLATSRTFSMHK